MINWGIIGLGRIAYKFADDLALLDGARLHAVASRSLERSRAFADQYNVPNYYGSYEEIINCRDLDAVYVATPHAFHAENTLLCLRNGMAVLCEKPLCINAREARAMIQAARESDTFLMEAMWTRFLPHLRKALELVQSGAIGELHTIKATLGFVPPYEPEERLFNPALGGGALLDIGVYPVFLSLLFFGKPDHIEATTKWAGTGVDEATNAVFHYDTGKRAEIIASLGEQLDSSAFLYGSAGHLHIHEPFNEPSMLTLHREGQGAQDFHFPLEGHGFYLETAEVMDCLRDNRKESSVLPLDFSLDVMETLDRVRGITGLKYPQD
jgi:predicted dehydrogenase